MNGVRSPNEHKKFYPEYSDHDTMVNTNHPHSDAELMLGLLRVVQQNKALTQRTAARELGVALGLVNAYLKRCVKKGFVKVAQAPSSRYKYYLTPKGFAEKSRLTTEFLSQSLSLFRQAHGDYEKLLNVCVERGWKRIALYGLSDLTDIVALYARDYPLEIVGVLDPHGKNNNFPHFPVFESFESLNKIDAYLITTLNDSQQAYEDIVRRVPAERVLTPALLDIYHNLNKYETEE